MNSVSTQQLILGSGILTTSGNNLFLNNINLTGGSSNIVSSGFNIYPFNVKSFGAIGDGSTNDYTAIMSCINSGLAYGQSLMNSNGFYKVGPIIYFPIGIYKITGALTFSGISLNFLGDGAGASTILQANNSQNCFTINDPFGLNNWSFKNLTLSADLNYHHSGCGIYQSYSVGASDNTIIQDCLIRGFKTGAYLSSYSNGACLNVGFDDNDIGVYLTGISNSDTFTNCSITAGNNGRNSIGYWFDQGGDISIRGGDIGATYMATGLYVNGAYNVYLEGCNFESEMIANTAPDGQIIYKAGGPLTISSCGIVAFAQTGYAIIIYPGLRLIIENVNTNGYLSAYGGVIKTFSTVNNSIQGFHNANIQIDTYDAGGNYYNSYQLGQFIASSQGDGTSSSSGSRGVIRNFFDITGLGSFNVNNEDLLTIDIMSNNSSNGIGTYYRDNLNQYNFDLRHGYAVKNIPSIGATYGVSGALGSFGAKDIMSFIGGDNNNNNLKIYGNASAISYYNPGGKGNRVGLINLSTNMSIFGTLNNWIDGILPDTAGGGLNAWGFNTNPTTGSHIIIDFGSPQIVNEVTMYFDSGPFNQGIFKWIISNDGINYTGVLETGFAISDATSYFSTKAYVYTGLANNTIAARYYALSGLAGTLDNNPYWNEVNFKIGTYNSNVSEIQTYNSTNPSGVLTLQPFTGQVIIGSLAPTTSAVLQIDSTNQGFLLPRMTTAQKNAINNPISGLMVYDTTLNNLNIYTGVWGSLGGGSSSSINTGQLTGAFYPLNGNPSGFISNYSYIVNNYGNPGTITNNDFSTLLSGMIVGGIGVSPSYSNTGGTGNRTSIITVTTNISVGGGTISNFIDGSFFGNSTNSWYPNIVSTTGENIIFNFGSSKLITEAKIYFDRTNNYQGIWKWIVSNDGINYSNIGPTGFPIGDPSIGQTFTLTGLANNVTGYQYYGLSGLAGTLNNNPWIEEIEFKIGIQSGSNPYISTVIQSNSGSNPFGYLFLQPLSGQTTIGSLYPNDSAKLQIDSTTQGFLVPRMTTIQKTGIVNPASGLMVYDTTSNNLNIYTGVWGSLGGSANSINNGSVVSGISISGLTLSGNIGVTGLNINIYPSGQNIIIDSIVPSVNYNTLINWTSGNTFYTTLTGNTNFTFIGQRDGQSISVLVKNTGTNGYTGNWPAIVKWSYQIPPTQTSGNFSDIYTFINFTGVIFGSTIQGF